MTEYRIVTFNQPVSAIAGPVGTVRSTTIDFLGSVPELSEQMDGWEIVNSQIIPAGDTVLLTFFLRTTVNAGDMTQS